MKKTKESLCICGVLSSKIILGYDSPRRSEKGGERFFEQWLKIAHIWGESWDVQVHKANKSPLRYPVTDDWKKKRWCKYTMGY